MKSRIFARLAGLAIALVIALAAFGCSKKAGIHTLIPNRAPTVEITAAPVDTSEKASYSVHIQWSGDDPDGRVDHYEFAIDPWSDNAVWHQTTRNDTTFTFPSTEPVPQGAPGELRRAQSPHTFVILAVDNLGAKSDARTRSFFSYTLAPSVRILSPLPSDVIARQLTPSMTVSWEGSDPDGYLVNVAKPLYYRYKVFEQGNSEFDFSVLTTKTGGEALRLFYAKTNFESWTKVGHDSTSVKLSGQTVGHQFVFVVVAFDTAGAYSPVFNLTTNMLQYEVGFAATLGPIITIFNESYYYTMPSGGYTPNDPVTWQHFELAADNQTRFNWFATPPSGSAMQSYRWRLDGDVSDETPRTNEVTDWYHWSAPTVNTTSCILGPFTPGIQRFLYIEAVDDNGLKSLLTLVLHPVRPTFANPLLIVDDTRLEPDQFLPTGAPLGYSSVWPASAELDTFLYARGGATWRGTVMPGGPWVTKPGIFAGYAYDTLGTRLGLTNLANGVPLSLLGKYNHVVWMVDPNSASNAGSGTAQVKPAGTLHYMCTPNHLNTLGTYISAGGSVWMLGGDAAKASLIEYDVRSNNTAYGNTQRTIWSNRPASGATTAELVPGRLMYDAAHWQSELASQTVALNATSVIKSTAAPATPWTSPGWNFRRPVSSPDYSRIPATMRRKLLSIGDSMPPTRTNSSTDQARFYSPTGTFDIEYMTQPNFIIEDADSDAFAVHEVSMLDTLMDGKGFSLANTAAVRTVAMTYYHGINSPEFVFSGFDIWRWHRSDNQDLVDFVLNGIWRLPLNLAQRTVPQNGVRPGVNAATKARPGSVPAAAGSRLPTARTAGQ
jgi:hypothetical protein